MKLLHPLSRCEFMACVKHATASRVLRFALYAHWYGSFGRVVMEPISFNTSDSRISGLFKQDFALLRRSIKLISNVCGLSFSHLTNLVCERHI